MKKIKSSINPDVIKIIRIILGTAISCGILIMVAFAVMEMRQNNLLNASIYLLFIFLLQGLSRLVTFIKNRTKVNFFRFLLLFIYDIGIGVTIFFGKDNAYLYQVCGSLFCISFIFERLFSICTKQKLRATIFHGSLAIFALALGIALFVPNFGNPESIVLIICAFMAITTFIEVIAGSTSKFNLPVLSKIILKTYALEVIMGLLTTIVAFSLILMLYEEKITTFEEGLWYSFAVVTTIGFGDIVAVSLIGRIITVILGVYGIVVVAIITSIIVNFYNETTIKDNKKKVQEVAKDETPINKNEVIKEEAPSLSKEDIRDIIRDELSRANIATKEEVERVANNKHDKPNITTANISGPLVVQNFNGDNKQTPTPKNEEKK